ncbi:MAG: hypothetical protein L0I24_14705, partial [Pseudonocardia sp.]|nr:hypothetical protein [Pseudonocardia sp.]
MADSSAVTARDAIGPREVAVLVADPGRTATTFASVTDALRAARLLQRAARADDRPPPRVAVHIGDAHRPPDGRVDGAAARTCTRLRDIAGAGSIVVSGPAATTLDDPDLRDAGLHRLRDLSPPIRVFVVGTAPAPSSVDALPNNLPTQLTTFVGRDGDVDAVCAVLRRSRLVTLTGPGGCGKTRLAARAAAETVERWPDGVGWVELGAVRDPAAIPELVAAAVGVLPGPARDATPSLSRQLRDRRVLVCLDNCEHLLDASAALVQELLLSCPEVAILTTSREPLTVPGEAVWRVPPMNRADSVTLFRERAGLVRPDAAADDTAAVRTACARLDGMPLAVELAAAWTGTLTPQQIVRGIDDRFALLIRGPRGVAARHQTLAASIDWSHDLLADADRVLFRRLAAFHGSFTLDAARAVAAFGDLDGSAVLAGLRRLVDKSLVVAEAGRYRMLESLHRYADTRLRAAGEHDVTRDRLLDAVLAMVEEAGPDLDGDKDAYVATLALEHENLTVALERGLLREDAEPVRRLAAGLAWLWHLNGHGAEGIEVLRAAIERSPRDRSALQGRLLTGLALVADTARPLGLEYDAAQAGLEIATDAGDARTRCMALQLCAVGRFYTDFDAAWDYATTAAAEALAAGETFVVHGTEALKGIILHLRADHVAAVPRLHAAVDGLLR